MRRQVWNDDVAPASPLRQPNSSPDFIMGVRKNSSIEKLLSKLIISLQNMTSFDRRNRHQFKRKPQRNSIETVWQEFGLKIVKVAKNYMPSINPNSITPLWPCTCVAEEAAENHEMANCMGQKIVLVTKKYDKPMKSLSPKILAKKMP